MKLKLAVHNTGNVALKQVDFEATDLVASVNDATRDPTFKHIERGQIKFTHGPMDRIRPRASGDTEMEIEIPQDATPAVYRGSSSPTLAMRAFCSRSPSSSRHHRPERQGRPREDGGA